MARITKKEINEMIERCGGVKEILAGFARFERDTDYLEYHFKELLEKYPNRWVAIHDVKVVDTNKNLFYLISRLRKKGIPTNETVIRFLDPNPKPLILLRQGAATAAPFIFLDFFGKKMYNFLKIKRNKRRIENAGCNMWCRE